jgi:hypothetical protein
MDTGQLAAVALGGLIASGSALLVARLRAHQDRRRDQARDGREARRSARLITEELLAGRRLLDRAREKGHYTWEPPKRLLPTDSWTRYRSDFAAYATDEDWAAVAEAFAEFDRLNWHLIDVMEEERWTHSGPHHPLEQRDLAPSAKVDEALAIVEEALGRLRALGEAQELGQQTN